MEVCDSCFAQVIFCRKGLFSFLLPLLDPSRGRLPCFDEQFLQNEALRGAPFVFDRALGARCLIPEFRFPCGFSGHLFCIFGGVCCCKLPLALDQGCIASPRFPAALREKSRLEREMRVFCALLLLALPPLQQKVAAAAELYQPLPPELDTAAGTEGLPPAADGLVPRPEELHGTHATQAELHAELRAAHAAQPVDLGLPSNEDPLLPPELLEPALIQDSTLEASSELWDSSHEGRPESRALPLLFVLGVALLCWRFLLGKQKVWPLLLLLLLSACVQLHLLRFRCCCLYRGAAAESCVQLHLLRFCRC